MKDPDQVKLNGRENSETAGPAEHIVIFTEWSIPIYPIPVKMPAPRNPNIALK